MDTRAQRQVRRLSGGNQQKVTIARWLANGFGTLLCFDPTRGIDVGTKRQIYALLRELAEAGAAVLLFTSELAEIPLVCDRVVCLYSGADHGRADAAGRRRGDAAAGDARPRRRGGRVSTADATVARPRARIRWRRLARATPGRPASTSLLLVLVLYWQTMPAEWATFDVQSLAIDALPLAFAAMAQAVVIISGGIDLSVGSLMSVVNVISAKYMLDDPLTPQTVSFREAILISILLVIGAALAGAMTGADHR